MPQEVWRLTWRTSGTSGSCVPSVWSLSSWLPEAAVSVLTVSVPGRRTYKGRRAGSWFGKSPTVCCSEEWARVRQRGSKGSVRSILKAGCPSLIHLPKMGN